MPHVGLNPKEQDKAAQTLGKLMANNMEMLNINSFRPGNIVLFSYPDAKYKDKLIWDKVPLAIVLDVSATHVLGLNLHWVSLPHREIILKAIFKLNSRRVKRGQPLIVTYRAIRPILQRLGVLDKAIHLYLNNRIVKRGLVIPASEALDIIKVSKPAFSKSFDYAKMYRKQSKATKAWRSNRKHGESLVSKPKTKFVRM